MKTITSIACALMLVAAVGVSAQTGGSLVRRDVGVPVYPGAQFDEPLAKLVADLSAQQMKAMGPLPAGSGLAVYVTGDDIAKVVTFYKALFPKEDWEIETKTGEELRKDALEALDKISNPTYRANIKALADKMTEGKVAGAMVAQNGRTVTITLASPVTDFVNARLRPGTEIWIMVLPQPK